MQGRLLCPGQETADLMSSSLVFIRSVMVSPDSIMRLQTPWVTLVCKEQSGHCYEAPSVTKGWMRYWLPSESHGNSSFTASAQNSRKDGQYQTPSGNPDGG